MKATATRPQQTAQIDPLTFFGKLKWLDGRTPLMTVIDAYRQALFTQALYTFTEEGWPQYNLALLGRGKKNWKSADLILAALYRCFAWRSPGGNQCYIIANDAEQASDDLQIAKLLVRANPLLAQVCTLRKNKIVRRDGKGFIEILPARDVAGAHGKTYSFIGYDEIHEYRSWDLPEALQPDPTRPDALQWITSYASIYHYAGIPLFDLRIGSGADRSRSRPYRECKACLVMPGPLKILLDLRTQKHHARRVAPTPVGCFRCA